MKMGRGEWPGFLEAWAAKADVFFEVIVKSQEALGVLQTLYCGRSRSVIPVTPYSVVDRVTRDTDHRLLCTVY